MTQTLSTAWWDFRGGRFACVLPSTRPSGRESRIMGKSLVPTVVQLVLVAITNGKINSNYSLISRTTGSKPVSFLDGVILGVLLDT